MHQPEKKAFNAIQKKTTNASKSNASGTLRVKFEINALQNNKTMRIKQKTEWIKSRKNQRIENHNNQIKYMIHDPQAAVAVTKQNQRDEWNRRENTRNWGN